MQFDEDPECDYDLFRDLTENTTPAPEHPLDVALRTNDAALRCYYYEHGEAASWAMLSASEREGYNRPPSFPEARLPSGTFYVYGQGGCAVAVTETYAREHWIHSFRAR